MAIMQFQLEVPNVVLGFSIGAVAYLIFGFVTKFASSKASLSRKGESLGGDDSLAVGADAEEEAGAEPSPEPSPEQLPAAAHQWRPFALRLRCAAVVLLAVAALTVLVVPLQPQQQQQPLPELPEQQPAEPQPPLAAPVPEPEKAPAAASGLVETPTAAAALEPAATHGEAGEAGKDEAAELPLAVATESIVEANDSGIMTLSLTRQQISIPQEDGIYYKTAYWGTVSVGEPPVPFSVVFDTGSGHLILPSTYCHSETCRVHNRYRRSHSSTAKDIDYDGSAVLAGELRDHITVSFGTGEVTGVFIEDVVCMGKSFVKGSARFNNSAVQYLATHGAIAGQRSRVLPDGCMGLRMIAATEMSEDPFKDFQFDGVLGLGLTNLSQAPEFNLMHVVSNMMETHGRNPNMFAVFLAEHEAEESQITFGGYVEDRLDEELTWLPVYQPELGQWMVQIKSIRIDDGTPFDFCDDGECRAIVDTGTSLIAVPSVVFPELFELLTHPAEFDECKGDGPKFHIELEGATVTLEPRDYALLERSTKSRTRALITQREDDIEEDMCKAMLMAMDLPEPLGPKLFVLGEPVLRRYYTVYDSGSAPRVGLARARHSNGVLIA
mmetsp:Transcript_84608/g.234598  ORF Transcript_84608/g.234598 Transcript_84608/m.234598 type:complete len:609 (-) Transcript_84608:39-1865(-)